VIRRANKADAPHGAVHEDGKDKPPTIDTRIGARLRLRRTVLGLTLADLGARCAISAQQVHKYEQGLSSMSAARLAQVAAILAVPVGWFFEENDPSTGLPSELINVLADPHNMKVISLLIRLKDPKAKQLVAGLVQNVVDYAEGALLERDQRAEIDWAMERRK
jgi:transcriptional regulator with XRE-family HTH domain